MNLFLSDLKIWYEYNIKIYYYYIEIFISFNNFTINPIILLLNKK